MIKNKYSINVALHLIIASFIFTGCSLTSKNTPPDPCFVRRAAFDIGSGSTKMKVADVDTCDQKIVQVIYEQEESVNYREDLSKNNNQNFSPEIIKTGADALKKLKQKAREYDVEEKNMAGVATAAFRHAKNAESVVKQLSREINFPLNIIEQNEEGILGFYSALSVATVPRSSIVVWDIGAGSQQITVYDNLKKDFHVFEGQLAAVTFKDLVLKQIQKSKKQTPNPMSTKDVEKAISASFDDAKKNVSSLIHEKIADQSGLVYGIGGVHYMSVKGQIGRDRYSLDSIMTALNTNMRKTDKEINTQYASSDVTNLALIAGYMKALNIKEVVILNINNTNGVLVNPKFW